MNQTEIRERLSALKDEIMQRVEKTRSDLTHREQPLPKDFEEQAIATENDDVLQALDEEGREQLTLIESALSRLDNGTYGICTQCGARIDERRLAAVPYTDTCIDCARESNNS